MKISVIVTVYNRPEAFKAALRSVLSQTSAPGEIVVVDDHSDAPVRIGRLPVPARLVRLDRNRGPGPARNEGARRASGDVVLFLDSDDLLFPNAVEVIRGVHSGGAADAAYPLIVTTRNGRVTARTPLPDADDPLCSLAVRNFIHAPSGFSIRRDLFLASGGFDLRLRVGEDVALYTRLLSRQSCRLAMIPFFLVCRTVGGDNLSNDRRMTSQNLLGWYRKWVHHPAFRGLGPELAFGVTREHLRLCRMPGPLCARMALAARLCGTLPDFIGKRAWRAGFRLARYKRRQAAGLLSRALDSARGSGRPVVLVQLSHRLFDRRAEIGGRIRGRVREWYGKESVHAVFLPLSTRVPGDDRIILSSLYPFSGASVDALLVPPDRKTLDQLLQASDSVIASDPGIARKAEELGKRRFFVGG